MQVSDSGRASAASASNKLETSSSQPTEVLSFHLDAEEYAINILTVQEIRGWDRVTRIPRMPSYVRGVLNLRGAVVPVIDLRLRFGLPAMEYGPTTVIIVVSVTSGTRTREMGVVVDSVSDVYQLEPGEMKPAPEFGTSLQGHALKGLITKDDRTVIVLDIDRILNSDELAILED